MGGRKKAAKEIEIGGEGGALRRLVQTTMPHRTATIL